MKTTLPLLCLLLSCPALAASRAELLTTATDGVTRLQDDLDDTSGGCRKKTARSVSSLAAAVRAAASALDDATLKTARAAARRLADDVDAACSSKESRAARRSLDRVAAALDDALAAPGPVPFGTFVKGVTSLFGGVQVSNDPRETRRETTRTTRTETINGRSVLPDDDEADDEAPRAKKKAAAPERGGFGATCRKNVECESNTCFVGSGELGFCTRMCSGDLDCPGLGFECRRPANLNAPQRLCLQERD